MKLNKNYRVLIVLALLISMMSSSLAFAADTSAADGTTYGAAMGAFDGEIAGREALNANKVNNYLSAIATDTVLISRFSLTKDNSTFQNSFLRAYKDAFQTAYQAAYRAGVFDKYIAPIDKAYEQGASLGTVQGQVEAMIDYSQGAKNDWAAAYADYISKGSLISRYNLIKELLTYRTSFANGYKEAFMKGYIETFQNKNIEIELRNKNAKQITMAEATITYDDDYVDFSMGSMGSSTMTPLSLYVPEATVYEPTYVSVFKTQDTFNFRNYNTSMTPVSSKYTISVWNNSGSVSLRRPITLSFQYEGSERAGIYRWTGKKWLYQYTTLTDGAIMTTIPAGYFNGGEYAIFIDETFKHVSDITFNWAYKEIYTLIRRDVISDGANFNPNSKITRGTFALMAFNAISGTDPLRTSTKVINDFDSLKWYQDAAKYMVNKGYMKLDAKGNFNASGEVSYADAEHMLSVMFTRNVKWTEVSNKMMTEKFVRSVGATNTSASMTKAEAAYMLTVFYK